MSDQHANLLAAAEGHYALYVSCGNGFEFYRGFVDACLVAGVDPGRIQAIEMKVTAQVKGIAKETAEGEFSDEEELTPEDVKELEEIVGWIGGNDPFFQDEMSGSPTQ